MFAILAQVVNALFIIMHVLLFARIILSWFQGFYGTPLMELLYNLTEPILRPIRSIVQRSPLGGPGMVLDFAPLIAFILIRVLQGFVVGFLETLS